MKKIILSVIAIAALTINVWAQSPEAFKYQAVVRDASQNIIPNQAVGMQLTIMQGSTSGTIVYQETFAPTSNSYGLVNLEIGTGTVVSGTFASIDWANGPYFIETAMDATGGTTYIVMGASQLVSVPYALYSKEAGSAVNDSVNDADSVVGNEYNTSVALNGTDLETTDGGGTITTDLSSLVDDADADSTNELQTLNLSGDTLTISNGNNVILPASGAGNWTLSGANIYNNNTGKISIGTLSATQKINIGDTGTFIMQIGHEGNFNEVESGRLAFTEDIAFNGTCGFEFHHDGAANTLSLESGCTTLSDTSIVFTRTGEVRIPERVKIGENSNPSCDVHVKQSSSGTTPGAAGIRLESDLTTDQNQIWTDGVNLNFAFNGTRISFISNTGAYTQVSDRRLKNNITPMKSVLSDVLKLKPVEYFYNESNSKFKSKGFIAQDVQEVYPELVNESEDTKMLAVQYIEFGVIAVKAIQEQQEMINKQQDQINSLIEELKLLKSIIKKEVSTNDGTEKQPDSTSVKKNSYANDADQL